MGRTLDPARLGDHIDRHYCAACALTGSRIAADDLVQDNYAKVLAKPRLLRNDDDIGRPCSSAPRKGGRTHRIAV